MSKRFRHEDVSSVPTGWKVRTVSHGTHRVRVAFPPGRKQTGSGRLVSILHPLSGANPCPGNPCSLRSTNPAELLIMGANPPRRRNASSYRVVAVAKYHGADITRDFEEKKDAKAFAKTISLKDYFRPHIKAIRSNPAELVVMAANPRVEVVSHGANPPVEEITEEFTGQEVKWLDVYNEPHMPQGRYAQLAKLFRLLIKPVKGGQVQRVTFNEENAPLIVSDSSAKQIYFAGGSQDLSGSLETFGAEQRTDGKYILGDGREIHYLGKKHHIGDDETEEWRHKHGEEDGALPTVLFDPAAKRILYEGGNYRIDGPWIHN